ncbi:MAG TPA: conjugal transfer protein TrbE [Allosphingosinicella sp.]|nr:conjugal transfer protein TrbE [Allosphingosinicella sp.]
MLNMSEYRRRAETLADHLPWAALVAPGIILNKDGSFQRTFTYRGPDLDSATNAELVSVHARANNALKRFGSGWALFFEAARIEAGGYPESHFPDPASWLVDEERKAAFDGERDHFESNYYLTLLWMPPPDAQDQVGRRFIEGWDRQQQRDWREALQGFVSETSRAQDLFASFMPEFRALGDAETLTYLHGTVSERSHRLRVPSTPFYLDALLADTPLTGGLEPMLGDLHLRTVTLLGLPSQSQPGLLDALNAQGFAYRWTTRFIPLDRTDASRALARIRRHWFNKRKSVTALLREVVTNQPVQLVDSDADNKVADADAALQLLGDDEIAFGYLTATVTVSDTDPARAGEKLRAVERVVNGLGFTLIRERLNAVEAWLSSLPGHAYANVRQPLIHTLNLAHLVPLSALWAGPKEDRHLGGPPLLVAETGGATPFRLSAHVGDVGHMLIVGPTGAGKSVLLSLLAMQFRRYEGAQVFIFDKGRSARAAVLAMGGTHHELGSSDGLEPNLQFQPLRGIGEQGKRAWVSQWIESLLEGEGVKVTPDAREAIWSALASLALAPAAEQTLTGLVMLLQSNALKAALAPFTLEGPFGRLLDAAEDNLSLAPVHCFETEELMAQPGAIRPVLSYLFHRLEERFDGKPTLLILDEAWLFLDHPDFSARIRSWLKTLRKKNVAVIFATQSLADISESSIAPAVIESCPQRIFLPNARALEPQSASAYRRFGLNERQLELIATATPKRDYYLQSALGNRLFNLTLGKIALAFTAASDPASQQLITRLLHQHGRIGFATALLEARGLSWASDLIGRFPNSTPQRRG